MRKLYFVSKDWFLIKCFFELASKITTSKILQIIKYFFESITSLFPVVWYLCELIASYFESIY